MLRRLTLLLGLAGASVLAACAGRSDVTEEPADAGADVEDAGEADADAGPPPVERADKVDILLVVDNSRNLDVAQDLHAESLPYLLDRLAHPACVNGLGNVVSQTTSAGDPCPVGRRDFSAVRDFHVGVISTSLGGHGADTCSPLIASWNPTQNDASHLLARAPGGGIVATYANAGFLAWDPAMAMSPPGDSDLPQLDAKVGQILAGVGTSGCGFESQLESIYRFLVDPNPYESIPLVDGKATPTGTDQVVLQQRADFLRPDSLLLVVLLTDENDCSTREGGRYFFANESLAAGGDTYHLPHARTECATSVDDPCCGSCGTTAPAGCPPNESDPACQSLTTDAEDPINLRCFDQKRRFGIDFLYPVDRYVAGLSETKVPNREGDLVDNPLFVGGRSPDLLVFAGIVGVPWQDVATDPKALPAGFRTATQIDWPSVIGVPEAGTPPSDPLMVESIAPRTGTNPATGIPLAPPDSPLALSNPINGHERVIPAADDLQYACIYPRPAPLDCTGGVCECTADSIETNPICQQPDGSYGTQQRFARALPSTRELRVLQGLGERAVVGSVCAEIVTGPSQVVYGYKPAFDAVLRAMSRHLDGGPEH